MSCKRSVWPTLLKICLKSSASIWCFCPRPTRSWQPTSFVGERLYCQDKHRADEFELYVLRRAGDVAPLERERLSIIAERR